MSIRATIMTLAVPLFLVLGAINGVLLLVQERAELRHALDDQARAVAVTLAHFIRGMGAPERQLASPAQRAAMSAALGRIAALDGVYLVEPGQPLLAISPSTRLWDLSSARAPARTQLVRYEDKSTGHPWVAAFAPAGSGRFVAVRLSAASITEHMQSRQLHILVVAILLGLVAAMLSWLVARRITHELRINHDCLTRASANDAEVETGAGPYRIREAQDLADAVQLIEASRRAGTARDRLVMTRLSDESDIQRSLKAMQRELFRPSTVRVAGLEVALRVCGEVPHGSFFAVRECLGEGAVVLGCCAGDTAFDALARAAAARRLIEDPTGPDTLDRRLALLRQAFPVTALAVRHWHAGKSDSEPTALLSLAETRTVARAEAYCRTNDSLASADILAGLDMLMQPNGLFALIRASASAECDDSGVKIRLDREDAAESADVEHLPNGSGQAAEYKPVA